MINYKNQIALEEAILIANDIISEAKKDENGIFWETLELSPSTKIYNHTISENIYIGNSGILLFLTELYRINKSEDLLKIIELSAKWLTTYCDNHTTNKFGFYVGRGGVSYTLCKVGAVTNNPKLIQKAINYLDGCSKIILQEHSKNFDLLIGVSGTILSLLHILQYSDNDKIYRELILLVKVLIENIQVSNRSGIVWNRMSSHMHALCGLSHGAAGISLVLFEISKLFKSPDIETLAYQAYNYEQSFYNSELGNWPDFRTGLYEQDKIQEAITKFSEGDEEFTYKPNYMAAWCHGAPGIGLARLKFYQYTNDLKFKNEIDDAIKTTLNDLDLFDNFSLCHGTGGNMAFILTCISDLNDISNKDEMLKLAESIVNESIKSRKQNKHYKSGYAKKDNLKDISLFTGSAGVGYFMLMNFAYSNHLDILCPTPTKFLNDNKLDLGINITELFCRKLFPTLINVIRTINKEMYFQLISEKIISKSTINIASEVSAFLETYINRFKQDISILREAFDFDHAKIQFNSFDKGDVYLYVNEASVKNKNIKLFSKLPNVYAEFNPMYSILTTGVKWHTLKFDQIQPIDITEMKFDKYYYLTKRGVTGVSSIYLEPLTYHILSLLLKNKLLVTDLIEQASNFIKINKPEDRSSFIYSQVQELVKANILILTPY